MLRKSYAAVAGLLVAACTAAAPAAIVQTLIQPANGVNPLTLQPNTTYTFELRALSASPGELLTGLTLSQTFDPLFPVTTITTIANTRFTPDAATAALSGFPVVALYDVTTSTPGTRTVYAFGTYNTNQTPSGTYRSNSLTLNIIPEPAGLTCLAAGGLMLGRRRRV